MPNPSTPTELYTTKTMFTLGGSSAAVWLVTTILALVFNVDIEKYKWIGLCVALAISFIGATRLKRLNVQFATVAFFNGLLIYVTAVGIDSINQGVNRNRTITKAALIPLTVDNPWWPTIALVDSVKYYKLENIKAEQLRNELELSNKLLKDSLAAAVGKSLSEEIDLSDKFERCLARTRSLELEIARLTKEPQRPLAQEPKSVVGPEVGNEIVGILPILKSLNKDLLNNLNKYLDAGELNPKAQLEASRNMNEKIFTLRLQIEEYNSRIDQLIKKAK